MSNRLYAQLRPDGYSLARLRYIQTMLPLRGRKVSLERIHLTLIHFGIIEEIIESVPADGMVAMRAVQRYIAATKKILATFQVQEFTLQPIGFDLFGDYKRTLVIVYEPTPILIKLHELLLATLRTFFVECDIEDVEGYMRGDNNFKHALTINPHITIAKGYDGKLPVARLDPVVMTIMPFEY